ncbi:hypothetical protein JHK86_004443 [Glycine max]|nr:hypothetical protein JHK86_004443 [Glycine max]
MEMWLAYAPVKNNVADAIKSEGDGFLAIAYFTFSSNIVDHLKSNSLVISNTIGVFIDLFKELAFLTKERDAHSLCGLLPPTFSSQQLQVYLLSVRIVFFAFSRVLRSAE